MIAIWLLAFFFFFLFFFSIKSPSSSNDASKVELLCIAIVNNTFFYCQMYRSLGNILWSLF